MYGCIDGKRKRILLQWDIDVIQTLLVKSVNCSDKGCHSWACVRGIVNEKVQNFLDQRIGPSTGA